MSFDILRIQYMLVLKQHEKISTLLNYKLVFHYSQVFHSLTAKLRKPAASC